MEISISCMLMLVLNKLTINQSSLVEFSTTNKYNVITYPSLKNPYFLLNYITFLQMNHQQDHTRPRMTSSFQQGCSSQSETLTSTIFSRSVYFTFSQSYVVVARYIVAFFQKFVKAFSIHYPFSKLVVSKLIYFKFLNINTSSTTVKS